LTGESALPGDFYERPRPATRTMLLSISLKVALTQRGGSVRVAATEEIAQNLRHVDRAEDDLIVGRPGHGLPRERVEAALRHLARSAGGRSLGGCTSVSFVRAS
jgi:hypothetical protein